MEKEGRIFRSFKEAEEYEDEYYANLTPEERLDIMCALCHDPDARIERPKTPEDAKRLARVIRPESSSSDHGSVADLSTNDY